MKIFSKLRSGQAMVEYILVLVALLGVVGVSWYLLAASKHSVVRTERLVGSDYP